MVCVCVQMEGAVCMRAASLSRPTALSGLICV